MTILPQDWQTFVQGMNNLMACGVVDVGVLLLRYELYMWLVRWYYLFTEERPPPPSGQWNCPPQQTPETRGCNGKSKQFRFSLVVVRGWWSATFICISTNQHTDQNIPTLSTAM